MADELLRAMQIRLRTLAQAQRALYVRAAPTITKRQLLDLAVKQELQRLAQLAAREAAARNEGAAMTYRTLAEVIPEIARDMTP